MAASNPLVRDRDVDFLLDEVHDVLGLCSLPAFAEHSRETFSLFLASAAKLARERLFPLFRAMDDQPAVLVEGRVRTHPAMAGLWDQLVELGLINATRPAEVGGAQLPHAVSVLGYLYLMAGNGGAAGYPLLTSGAAHLLESFASPALQEAFMTRMYAGEWTGTMSLTEPQAGSGLGDLTSKATPIAGREAEGVCLLQGSKIFISGGDHDFRDNVVHLTLARRVGDPAGTKGISLFAVPRMRPVGGDLTRLLPGGDGALEFNDVHTTQLVHKIGWKGLPSLGLGYGEQGDCMGWLVGEPCKGLLYMFQMMNEARVLVGANATATASAAFHEALAYARERTQGRKLGRAGASEGGGPVAIIEHPDVRRMLLRSKAIVEGSMSLLVATARLQDLAGNHGDPSERERAQLILDTLTPIAKTFPAERGFEVNTLAVQIHGGYGYSSEYLPELWMREQKLNSIHEGTTGIQGLDLLGRKVVAKAGKPLELLSEEIRVDVEQARSSGVDEELCQTVTIEVARIGGLTRLLAGRGLHGDLVGMLAHSHDYLTAFSNLVIAWQWIKMSSAACLALRNHLEPEVTDYYHGKLEAARYWVRTELADNARLALLCEIGEDSYLKVPQAGW